MKKLLLLSILGLSNGCAVFQMTSTSSANVVESVVLTNEVKKERFVAKNREILALEAAKGQGEYYNTYIELFGKAPKIEDFVK